MSEAEMSRNLSVISNHWVDQLLRLASQPDREALEVFAARIDGMRSIARWEGASASLLLFTARKIDEEVCHALDFLKVIERRLRQTQRTHAPTGGACSTAPWSGVGGIP